MERGRLVGVLLHAAEDQVAQPGRDPAVEEAGYPGVPRGPIESERILREKRDVDNGFSFLEDALHGPISHETGHRADNLAMVNNPERPAVSREDAEWARLFVERSVTTLERRSVEGDVGQGEDRQVREALRAVTDYANRAVLPGYEVSQVLRQRSWIPYSYLHKRLAALAVFKKDRRGGAPAVKSVLEVLVMSGELEQVPEKQVREITGGKQKVYRVP
jgi:hypothetical protein